MPSRILSFERGRAERQQRRAGKPGRAAEPPAPSPAMLWPTPPPTLRQIDHRRAMLLHLACELAKCGPP